MKTLIYIFSCVIFLLTINPETFSQISESEIAEVQLIKKLNMNTNFYGIHIKKCPGQISGDKNCIRTLYLTSNIVGEPSFKNIKKGCYELKEGDQLVAFDQIAINTILYYMVKNDSTKEIAPDSILCRLNNEIDLITNKNRIVCKRKVSVYYTYLKGENAILLEVNKDLLNKIFSNAIKIISNKEKLPVIIFLNQN